MNFKALWIVPVTALFLCLGCTTLNATSADDPMGLFRGQLQVMIADDFKNQTATTHYRLIQDGDGAVLRLKFVHGAPKPALRSGTRVEIRGQRRDGVLRVETLRVLGQRKAHQ